MVSSNTSANIPPQNSTNILEFGLNIKNGADMYLPFADSGLPPIKRTFLETYAKTGLFIGSCKIAGCAKSTVLLWQQDPEFLKLFDDARQAYLERLEGAADARAINGIDKPVIYRGEITDTYKEYSDQLLIALLKRRDPAYRENSQVQINNNQVEVKVIEVRLNHGDGSPPEATQTALDKARDGTND